MIPVREAENIIQSSYRSFGTESIFLINARGRILAEDIIADRDIPPYDRVTMDGIAIHYKSFEDGNREFRIIATQPAGINPIDIVSFNECIEIMTGAALPPSTNTVIRYEDLEINNGIATIVTENIILGQNIHFKAKDKKKGTSIVAAGRSINPQIVSLAASVGKEKLLVQQHPKIVIISTGDELADLGEQPSLFQIRTSNSSLLNAALSSYGVATEVMSIGDNIDQLKTVLGKCLQLFDVLIITGGISMGKFDLVPFALKELEVQLLFQKVSQKPGKPFCFGKHKTGTIVFAFPGNPVSACLCFYRYFLPWFRHCQGLREVTTQYAILSTPILFTPPLTCFLQVKLHINEKAEFIASPIIGNGSGDYSSLAETDAFMELPSERNNFEAGEVFRVWMLSK